MPSPTESAPWGSKSTSSTRRPTSASAAPRLIVVVVLPTPPFWLQTATTRAGPCVVNGSGSANVGRGRPVAPRSDTRAVTWSGPATAAGIVSLALTTGAFSDSADSVRPDSGGPVTVGADVSAFLAPAVFAPGVF